MEKATTVTRRTALRQAAGAASIYAVAGLADWTPSAAAAARVDQAEMAVDVLLNEPIGTIKPGLYGHFTEHIGGVIYDGIWVGPDSKIPNIDGIRRSLVEHMLGLGQVVIRWPGGCFADSYQWRDGIGPASKRPRRFGRWQEDTESNQFGTHEFMQFCRLCKAEPYLAANVGSGTVEQFQRWVEYCNAPAGRTTLADERVANGDREPLGIRYWGVGNESWGCGGKFTPEDYCTEYRKFTEWVPGYGIKPFFIAAGPNGNDVDWTRRFFKKWTDYTRAPLHGWAAHYYCGTTGHALDFSRDQWYEMLAKANFMDRLIADQWSAMGQFDPAHKVKLVVDEWGCWHPKGTEINPHHLFEQMGCLRDALCAALTLDTFNRHADKMEMANVAQLINNLHSLFLADGDKFVATPNYHVFKMYTPHQGATSVRMDVQAPNVAFKAAEGSKEIFRVAGSASRAGNNVTLTLVHSHAVEPVELAIRVRDGSATTVRQTVLAHETLSAHNTFDKPDE
ncbi:MAG TPA: alpha-L-arabinofuranosidase C-terminal domain-containing protein, partial [Pirellulales bacterium]|nr:alpha-L-arabinofuranosidase C-terminal domain-containing protein [Pirellulales bacterium]